MIYISILNMFDTKQSTIQNKNVIKYNYLEKTLFPIYNKTPASDKYIEMSYSGNPSYPNLILGTTLYNTTKLYIYGGKTHPIKDLDYDGELVIEQSAITNWAGKVYTCIPLKTTNGIADTVIDQIISMTNHSTIPLSINQLLQQSANTKAVVYNDTGFFTSSNTIVVFLNPIHIRHSLKDFQTSSEILFSGYNPNYSIVNTLNINIQNDNDKDKEDRGIKQGSHIESFVEGAKSGCPAVPKAIPDTDVYISCQPADVSTEDVQSFNMPLTSDMIKENESTKMMKNTLSLFTIIFIVGFISYMFPLGYEMLVVDEIVSSYKDISEDKQRKKKVFARVSTMDFILSLIIMSLAFGLIADGIKEKLFVEKSVGMLIGAIYIMGWFMITNQRVTGYYRTILDKIGLKNESSTDMDNQFQIKNMDFFTFLYDIQILILKNLGAFGGALIFWLGIVFPALFKTVKPKSVSGFVLAYGLVFSIYLIFILDKNQSKFTDNSQSKKPQI